MNKNILLSLLACLASLATAADNGSFGLHLFRSIVGENKGNIVISPLSAEQCLKLAESGAAGKTLEEFKKLPYGRSDVASELSPRLANAIFAAEDLALKPQKTPVHRAPFATDRATSAKKINTWCSDNTDGLIPQLVTPNSLSADTRMVLLNAVVLKEKWLHPFEKSDTNEHATFTLADGKHITVPMMSQQATLRYAEGKDWRAVAIPYRKSGKGNEPGYFIGIRPEQDARSFVSNLTPEVYAGIRRQLAKADPQKASVRLPRFSYATPVYSLRNALQQQGLATAFSRKADFSGFTDEPVFISDVIQKAYVEVDEQGTKAAAVTGAIMTRCAAPVPRFKSISFDRPFIWIIGDLTTDATPFFMGLCEDPR